MRVGEQFGALGASSMVTRMLEFSVNRREVFPLIQMVHKNLTPIVETLPGFLGQIFFISNGEQDSLVVAMTIWQSHEDAVRYDRKHESKIYHASHRRLLAAQPAFLGREQSGTLPQNKKAT